jgi:hypothetical protein
MLRGSLWVGRTRFSVLAPFGFHVKRTDVEAAMTNPDVFWALDRMSPQPNLVLGFGGVSDAAMDGPLLLHASGVIVPCWFLAILTGVLPALWIGRRVRNARGPRQPSSQGQQPHAQPVAPAARPRD